MIRSLLLALGLSLSATPFAAAQEPIVGTWLRPSTQTLVTFAPCADGFCGTVQNGNFSGRQIGALAGSGQSYSGSITDLAEDKTYRGKATIEGDAMQLEGCVLVFCRGETWQRQ